MDQHDEHAGDSAHGEQATLDATAAPPALWPAARDSDFGLGLAGLIVAFVCAEGTGAGAAALLSGPDSGTFERVLLELIPVLGAIAGIALGALALRGRSSQVGRSLGAAAVAVGILAAVIAASAMYTNEARANDARANDVCSTLSLPTTLPDGDVNGMVDLAGGDGSC